MFPGFDPQALLAQAQAMQQQLADAQANLEALKVEGTSGGGVVTATVSGTGELLAIDLDAAVVDPADIETLADLIVAAVRDAQRQAGEAAATMTPGAGLDLSSMDLGSLGLGQIQPSDPV